MSITYIEELIPFHIRKQYNIKSKTKIGSTSSVIYNKRCRKCFDEHETRECTKDWIKTVYPETLEELISLYDRTKYGIETKTYIEYNKENIKPCPIVILSIDNDNKNEELKTLIRNYKLNFDVKKKDYNWDDLANIITSWCIKTGREIVFYNEFVNYLCRKLKIDENVEWEQKAQALMNWATENKREIIIGSNPPPSIGYMLKEENKKTFIQLRQWLNGLENQGELT